MKRAAACLCAVLGIGAMPASAAASEAVPACRTAVAEQWSDLVFADGIKSAATITTIVIPDEDDEPVNEPIRTERLVSGGDPLALRFAALREGCAGDERAVSDLYLLEMLRSFEGRDYDRVWELVQSSAPTDYPSARDWQLWMALVAAAQVGSDDQYKGARGNVFDANEKALFTRGWTRVEDFTAGGYEVLAYRLPGDESRWHFIGADQQEPILAAITVGKSEYQRVDGSHWVEFRRYGCSSSGGIAGEIMGWSDALAYEQVKQRVARFFETGDTGNSFSSSPSPLSSFCPNAAEILRGLGPFRHFTGAEYRAPDQPPSEQMLLASLASEAEADRSFATDYVMDHPDAVEPMAFIHVVTNLIQRGDMERAAFWYYFYRIRSRPWLKGDPSGNGALSASIHYSIGTLVNQWAMSDRDAWVDLWVRAANFERKAPLYPGRFGNASQEDWAADIAAVREQHDAHDIVAEAPSAEELAAALKVQEAYVGPWINRGTPLKDEWR